MGIVRAKPNAVAQRTIESLPLAAILLAVGALLLPSFAQAVMVNKKLNGLLTQGGNVSDFQISPDGWWVVYKSDQDTDEAHDLYCVPIEGGTPVRLNVALAAPSSVVLFEISPDSSRVGSLISGISRGAEQLPGGLVDRLLVETVLALEPRLAAHGGREGRGQADPTEAGRNAGLREELGHGAAEAAQDAVLLEGQDRPGLARRGEHRLLVERLDGVHREHAGLDAVLG